MCRVLLLACCLIVAATVSVDPIVAPAAIAIAAPVPKGAIAAPKSKEAEEEEKKAARYKALRESYECHRDSLPRDAAERCGIESDMNLAREVAQMLLDLEKIADPYSRALHRETWETSLKRQVADTPRRKELFEIYSYELGLTVSASLKSKNIEEEKAARYEALRRSYEFLLNSLHRGPGRFGLQDDMKLASEVAQERLDIEKSGHPVLKTFRLEKWEAGSKREVTRTPRLKELFELYSYELSQKK